MLSLVAASIYRICDNLIPSSPVLVALSIQGTAGADSSWQHGLQMLREVDQARAHFL